MIPPTPELIKRLLAEPIERRRALAEQGGPGWLVSTAWDGPSLYADPSDVPRMPQRLEETPAGHRCAWWPCSEVAWLLASGTTGGVELHGGGHTHRWLYGEYMRTYVADTIPKAVFDYWEATDA